MRVVTEMVVAAGVRRLRHAPTEQETATRTRLQAARQVLQKAHGTAPPADMAAALQELGDLDADGHESTVADLAKLTLEAWKHPLFRELVNTRRHTAIVKTVDGETREQRWTNTNHLLRTEGFYGVKT